MSNFSSRSTQSNIVQLGTKAQTPLAPVSMEGIIDLVDFSQSDKLYCNMHGHAYCFATQLRALPKDPLIDTVWSREMSPHIGQDNKTDKQQRFTESFAELFFQLKYKLYTEKAIVPEIFHRRPDLICDDSDNGLLHYWLGGIVGALAMTKNVPDLWIKSIANDYGEVLLEGMTRTINEFCEKHGINKQFTVDIVFDKFQQVIDAAFEDSGNN